MTGDTFNVGDRIEVTVTFERPANFAASFQWRSYNVMFDDPGEVELGVPVTLRGRIIGLIH